MVKRARARKTTRGQPVGTDDGRVTCVLFDLDGTLIDSAAGIIECLALTLAEFGHPIKGNSTLKRFVGPPIADTVRALTGLSEERVGAAVARYRELYSQRGIANSSVFSGISGMLGALRELGIPAGVATSKRESQAVALLELHGLLPYFLIVSGAGEDESHSSKAEVIGAALSRLASRGTSLARVVVVGDRQYDVTGASAFELPTIFAGWGYGAADEAAGALMVARSPARVMDILREPLQLSTQQTVERKSHS
jgi:phosphoglycolate phosphatase